MIINKANKKIIARDSRLCKSFICKFIGLMFSKRRNNFGLIFEFEKERRISLHTFFVFYPIDIVFLNEKKQVVEIKENMKPFSVYFPKEKSAYIIELNSGTIKKTKTRLKDELKF